MYAWPRWYAAGSHGAMIRRLDGDGANTARIMGSKISGRTLSLIVLELLTLSPSSQIEAKYT